MDHVIEGADHLEAFEQAARGLLASPADSWGARTLAMAVQAAANTLYGEIYRDATRVPSEDLEDYERLRTVFASLTGILADVKTAGQDDPALRRDVTEQQTEEISGQGSDSDAGASDAAPPPVAVLESLPEPTSPTPEQRAARAFEHLREVHQSLHHELVDRVDQLPGDRFSGSPGLPQPPRGLGEMWTAVHLALLRLSASRRTALAAEIRRIGVEAFSDAEVGFLADDLCAAGGTVLVPKLGTVCEGLALPGADVNGAGGRTGGSPASLLAERLDQAMFLVESCIDLFWIQNVDSPTVQPVHGAEAKDYFKKKAIALQRQLSSDSSSVPNIASNVDAAIGGLVHLPLAAPDSWWRRWRADAARDVSLYVEASGGSAPFYEHGGLPASGDADSYIKNCEPLLGATNGVPVQWVIRVPVFEKASQRTATVKGKVIRNMGAKQ